MFFYFTYLKKNVITNTTDEKTHILNHSAYAQLTPPSHFSIFNHTSSLSIAYLTPLPSLMLSLLLFSPHPSFLPLVERYEQKEFI